MKKSQTIISGLAGKLKPPVLRHVLERPRLLKLVHAEDKHKLVIIHAGPGYGKTTLMAQIAESFFGKKVWFQVDQFDQDPVVFLRHFLTGIAHACPGTGVLSMQKLNESKNIERDRESILAILLDELNECSCESLMVCIDDYHLLDEAQFAKDLFQFLIKSLPDWVTVVIASRTPPDLSLPNLRARRLLREISMNDLRFSRNEIKDLLVGKWNLKVALDVIGKLEDNTEGWAAGLVLLEDYLRTNIEIPEIFTQEKNVKQHLYEYLAEEVLSRQPSDVRNLLLKSSLIDPVDPNICDKALGIDQAQETLSSVEKMNLFTTRVQGSDEYRFHPLFRDFLKTRLEYEFGVEETLNLRLKFGEVLCSLGQYHKAIEQFIEANNERKTLEIIKKAGPNLLEKGEYATLAKWLEGIEDSTEPSVTILKAQLLMTQGKIEQALRLLRNTKQSLKEADGELYSSCSMKISECLCALNRYDEGVLILRSLLKMHLNSELRMELLYKIFVCNLFICDESGLDLCIRSARDLNNEVDSTYYLTMRAALYLWQGNIGQTVKIIKDVLALNRSNYRDRTMLMNNLAFSLLIAGNYDESRRLSEESFKRVEEFHIPALFPLVADTYGYSLIAAGEHESGFKLLEEGLERSRVMDGLNREACGFLTHLGTYARRQGNFEKAAEFHEKMINLAATRSEFQELLIGKINLGADLLRMDRTVEAEKLFCEVEVAIKKYNFLFLQTQLDFHRAWAQFQWGDKEKTKDLLKSTLRRSRKYHHKHFLIQEGKISFPMLSFAFIEGIETDYLSSIIKAIGSPAIEALEPLLVNQNASLRITAIRLIGTIGEASRMNILRRCLTDENERVRNAAKISLKIMRSKVNSLSDVLTAREEQVLKELASGAPNRLIGKRLFISETTVKTHINRIFSKLGVTNRIEAVLFYQNLEKGNQKYNLRKEKIQPKDDCTALST